MSSSGFLTEPTGPVVNTFGRGGCPNDFSDPRNWDHGTPQNGDSLVFSEGAETEGWTRHPIDLNFHTVVVHPGATIGEASEECST